MHPFDVDTGDELLAAPAGGSRKRPSDDLWGVAEKTQQATSRQRAWLIAVTVLAAVGLTVAVAALGTAAGTAQQTNSNSGGGNHGSSSDTKSSGWRQIQRLAFSSCTSYDVRPQPIWTQVSWSPVPLSVQTTCLVGPLSSACECPLPCWPSGPSLHPFLHDLLFNNPATWLQPYGVNTSPSTACCSPLPTASS